MDESEGVEDQLSPEQIRELKRSIADMENPIRYMIVSRLLPRWRLYFNAADDVYASDIDSGSLFKRRRYAEAILDQLDAGEERSDKVVAKVTTRGDRVRVVQYLGRD